jgi:hypothetical protein
LVLLEYLTLWFLDGFKSSCYLIHTLPLAGALFAIYAHFLFSKARRALLPVMSAALILFAAVQFTTPGRSFSVTPERRDDKNALAYLKRSGSPPSIIPAGEFAFAPGFDSGMVDDWRLGYFSGRRPPFIAANVIYSGWLEHSATLDPAIHAYMLRLLRDEYRVAFRNRSYTVYQRIGARLSTPLLRVCSRKLSNRSETISANIVSYFGRADTVRPPTTQRTRPVQAVIARCFRFSIKADTRSNAALYWYRHGSPDSAPHHSDRSSAHLHGVHRNRGLPIVGGLSAFRCVLHDSDHHHDGGLSGNQAAEPRRTGIHGRSMPPQIG